MGTRRSEAKLPATDNPLVQSLREMMELAFTKQEESSLGHHVAVVRGIIPVLFGQDHVWSTMNFATRPRWGGKVRRFTIVYSRRHIGESVLKHEVMTVLRHYRGLGYGIG